MKYFRDLTVLFTCLSFSLQSFAQGAPKPFRENPFPPLANVVYHSKNMRDFVERSKEVLTAEEYEFLAKKTEDLPKDVMPKAREIKPGTNEFRLQNVKVVVKTLSVEKQIYEVNGKKLELASLSLEQRLQTVIEAIGAKKSASIGNFLLPEANADGGATFFIAVVGMILGIISVSSQLIEKNNLNCAAISKAAIDCIELTGKLQIKVKETANFFLTQKKIEAKGDAKSEEIAKQTLDACKDLSARVSELEVVDFKGKSAMQTMVYRCEYDIQTLKKCQKGLSSSSEELKGFVAKYCSPEATTTSPVVKKANTETATAPDIPVIPDVLKKEASDTTTTK